MLQTINEADAHKQPAIEAASGGDKMDIDSLKSNKAVSHSVQEQVLTCICGTVVSPSVRLLFVFLSPL